jgi:succinate dehydrogenase / fumarate reductase cytochrome b subunit
LNPITSFLSSSIGRKWIVAVSGVALVGFVVGHLIGNLQVFLGPEPINRYGHFLQGLGELLWAVRFGLLAMVVLHIVFTIKLRLENRAARPKRYAVTKRVRASVAGRWMVWSGLMVLCFIVFHLLHFTAQTIHPEYKALMDSEGRHDVYRMIIFGFGGTPSGEAPMFPPTLGLATSGFYIVAVALLGLHLNHGFQSMFQTLGLNSGKVGPVVTRTGQVLSWCIFLGYASIPVAVLTHLVK